MGSRLQRLVPDARRHALRPSDGPDTASRRSLIEVRITPPTHDGVKAILTRVFNHVGLPDAIRSDNGSPFGSIAAGGLSRLSVWFLKLGIEVRHIPPSSPQDNGRHDRVHRTLKAETARLPADRWGQQQVRFNRCRRAAGARLGTMRAAIKEPWYDPVHEVRRV
jgi:transposase InsO family protein